ncbi:MAG: dUTP diphosphatase, partial [bacterium]
LQDAIKNSDGVEDADLENLINISYDDLEEEILKQQNTQKIKFKKLHDDVISPKYAYELDSGFDLYSTEKIVLPAFGRALVPTGLSLDLPEGYEIQVRTKSGLAVNLGLM